MESTLLPSRRRFLGTAGLAVAGAWLAPAWAGEPEPEPNIVDRIRRQAGLAAIDVRTLRGNVSVLSGSGGNIAVLHGPEGKLLVDAGITASRAGLERALQGLGPGPIGYLINTHWHFDHTDGNAWLHAAGATILAHENTRRRLSVDQRVDGWAFTFPASPAGALPAVTFRGDGGLHFNADEVRIELYEPAHTDSDLRVVFPAADIVHVGDTWWNGVYPFIDYSTGGGIDGMIRAARRNAETATADTIVIPGHGPVGGKRELAEFRDMLETVRGAVAGLKRQGRSLEATVAAKPTARFDAKWGNWVIGGDAFAALVYAGV